MSIAVITLYPIWFLLLCLALGAVLTWVLYANRKDGIETPWLRRLLMGFRFTVITLIAFLLLSPLIKTTTREIEKPVVIIALDNSASVVAGKDAGFYKKEFVEKIDRLREEIGASYEVKTLLTGENIQPRNTPDYADKVTNLSALFEEINNQYAGTNLGAVILASDGIYNQGDNPLYAAEKLKAPLFTIALGDTLQRKDLVLANIRSNEIAYLGNLFPVQLVVQAKKSTGAKTRAIVKSEGVTVFEQEITVNQENFSATIDLKLPADKPGTRKYEAELQPVDGEVSYVNNKRTFFIEVLNGRNKVLILAAAPHPDVAAMRQAIESNSNYEVKVQWAGQGANPDIRPYNLVILHQLPSLNYNLAGLLEAAEKNTTPLFFVTGSQTAFHLFNRASGGLTVQVNNGAMNEALPAFNENFALFKLSDPVLDALAALPPLQVPFGNYGQPSTVNTLFFQQIGAVRTSYPLLSFGQDAGRKTGVLFGEGFWRWRLYDFDKHKDHRATNELMTRVVQYLSVKNDKRPFRVMLAKNAFLENERIVFDAELYNESYQLVNEADIRLSIHASQGRKYDFTFGRSGNAYTLDAGYFAPGDYTWEARVSLSGKEQVATGRFAVAALELEYLQTTADHALLFNLAKRTGGEMFFPQNMENITKALQTREEIKPVSYMRTSFQDLVNIRWIFFLFVVLLGTEWFLRKRNGEF